MRLAQSTLPWHRISQHLLSCARACCSELQKEEILQGTR